MKPLFVGIGVIGLLVGVVWVLQGSDVIMNSAMSGSTFWLGAGVVVAVVGLALLVLGVRTAKPEKTV